MRRADSPYWQPARHARAGAAVGAVVAVAWLGALGVALAGGDSGGSGDRSAGSPAAAPRLDRTPQP
jgi:hypothetical protein